MAGGNPFKDDSVNRACPKLYKCKELCGPGSNPLCPDPYTLCDEARRSSR